MEETSKFVQLLDRVGLSLSEGRTIFAPSNEAFKVFREEDVVLWNKYASQPEFYVHMRDLLLWHMVTEDTYTTSQIFDGNRVVLENALGNITVDQQFQKIDNVAFVDFEEPNITTSEGIIHVLNDVVLPPYLGQDMLAQMLDDRSEKFAFSTMANLALWAGLDDKLNGVYENGITFLVPPNRRFNRAEINVPALLTDEMKNYTRDFVLCHMIMDNYHESAIFAEHQNEGIDTQLVTSELGTHMWITTTNDELRFQARPLILADQPVKNGIFHVMDFPLFPPWISDFTEFTGLIPDTQYDTSDCFRFFRQALLSSEEIALMFNTTLTHFCPTREAFAEFNNEDFNRLLEPIWVRHATEFLLNMIAPGARTRRELVAAAPTTITMLSGETYELRKSGTRPRIKNGPNEQARSEFGDLIALDGYVHVTDKVITPTAVSQSIYDRSRDNEDFSLLVENIDFVDLTDLVDRDLPLTFLAPPNKAWRRITFGAFEGGEIIKRHIYYGLLFWDVIANVTNIPDEAEQVITSVDGDVFQVERRGEFGENLWVGGGYIYEWDILCRNGVLHYIDRVLGEPYDTVSPTVSPAPTITPEPTIYVPPTPAPVPTPTGQVPIEIPPSYLPPQTQPVAAPPVNNQPTSDAPTLRWTSLATTTLALFLCGIAAF